MSWEKQAGQVAYSAWSRSKPFGGLASLEKTILSSENLPACEQTADLGWPLDVHLDQGIWR